MKPHVPRKLKKKAKKLKAAHDALVMLQSAMVSAQSMAQVSIISDYPRSIDMAPAASIAMKAVKVAQVVSDSAKAVSNCLSQIKPWYGHVQNYKPRV